MTSDQEERLVRAFEQTAGALQKLSGCVVEPEWTEGPSGLKLHVRLSVDADNLSDVNWGGSIWQSEYAQPIKIKVVGPSRKGGSK